MNVRSNLAGSVKLSGTIKGKRKAAFDDHDNPMPGPRNSPGMAAPSLRVGRQLPNLAPKPSSINPDPGLVESEPVPLHKRPRIDHLETPPQLPLGALVQPETNPTSEQSMYLTNNNTWSHSDILGIGPSIGSSNALPITGVIQGSESQILRRPFDLFSELRDTSQAEAACSSFVPSMFQRLPATTITVNSQVPITQTSVGCCPRCRVILRDLRESIVAIACGQGLPTGGGAMGELWRSYFGLEDHLNEGHVSEAGELAG